MPTLTYKGHKVNFESSPSQEDIDQTVAYLDSLPEKQRETSITEDVGIGVKNLGHTAKTAWDLTAGGVANLLGDIEGRDKIFASMDARIKAHEADMAKLDQGFGGKITSGIFGIAPLLLTAPITSPLLLAGGLSGALALENTARDVRLGQNYTPTEAVGKTMVEGGINTAAAMLPVGKEFTSGALLGAGGNIVAQGTSDILGQVMTKGEASKPYEFNAENYAVNAVVGGGVGGLAGEFIKEPGARVKYEYTPTKEDLAFGKDPVTEQDVQTRLKEQSLHQVEGFDRDINAIHEQAFREETRLSFLVKEKDLLEEQLSKTKDTEEHQIIKERLDLKNQQIELKIQKIQDLDAVILKNELAYKEARAASGQDSISPLDRIKVAHEKAVAAGKESPSGNIEAIERSYIAMKRTERALKQSSIGEELLKSPETGLEGSTIDSGGIKATDTLPGIKEVNVANSEKPILSTDVLSKTGEKQLTKDAEYEPIKQLGSEIETRLEQELGIKNLKLSESQKGLYHTIEDLLNSIAQVHGLKQGTDGQLPLIRTSGNYIDILELPSSWQRNGLGSKLLKQIETDIYNSGKDSVFLQAIPDSVGFWGKHGYVKDPVQVEETGENIMMHKDLTKSFSSDTKRQVTTKESKGTREVAKLENDITKLKSNPNFASALNEMANNSRKIIDTYFRTAFKVSINKLHDNYVKWKLLQDGLPVTSGSISALDYDVHFYEDFPSYVVKNLYTDLELRPLKDTLSSRWGELKKQHNVSSTEEVTKNILQRSVQLAEKTTKSFAEAAHQVLSVNATRQGVTTEALYKSFSEALDNRLNKVGPVGRPDITKSWIEDTDALMKELKHYKDIKSVSTDLSQFDNLIMHSIVPLLQKARIYDNPAVRYAVKTIYNAEERKNALVHKILGGKAETVQAKGVMTSVRRQANKESFQRLSEVATDKDFYEVYQVFKKGQNEMDYETSLHFYGKHLTPFQKKLFRSTADVYSHVFTEMNKHQMRLGKNTMIKGKLGYVAPVRLGDFVVSIGNKINYASGVNKEVKNTRGISKLDISDTVYVQRFTTEAEAQKFINEFNKLNTNNKYQIKTLEKVNQIGTEFQLDFIKSIRETLVEEGASATQLDKLDKMVESYVTGTGSIGGHHLKQMGFIEGGKGSELFYNKADQGRSFRDSIFGYVGEVTTLMKKQEIATKLDDVLTHPEFHNAGPNLTEFLISMRDYAVNATPENLLHAKAFKQFLDTKATELMQKLGKIPGLGKYKEWHPDKHVFDSVLGKNTHLFYIHALMSRPAFWVAQTSAFFLIAREQAYHTTGPFSLLKDMVIGATKLQTNDKEFFKFVDWVVQNRSTFHPQFVNDLNKFGVFDKLSERTQHLVGYVTGETPATAADSFSRIMAASMLFETMSKKGLKGQKLYEAVAEGVDANMIQYGTEFKAPMYRSMGVLGDLTSPLVTFSQAQISNLVADIKHFARNKDARSTLPLMATMLMTMSIGGLMGAPFVAELEVLLHAFNALLRSMNVDYQLPTIMDWILGSPTAEVTEGKNKFVDRSISHGLISSSTLMFSQEGYDIGSSNRWRPLIADIVTGEKQWNTIAPVLSWDVQLLGAVTDLTFNSKQTPGENRIARQRLFPGYMFGINETVHGSYEEGVIPQGKDDTEFNKTFDRATASILGTQTIDMQTKKARFRRDDLLEKELNQEVRKIARHIALNAISDEEVAKYVTKLSSVYKKDVNQIASMLENTIIKSNFAREDMPNYKKKFSMPTAQEIEVQDRYVGEE